MKKITKNYYQIVAQPFCSVFLDEHLMKKANKILYKYQLEIRQLLDNNRDHLIKHEWSLCYPNEKQTSFYSANPIDDDTLLVVGFETKLVKNIFDIGDRSIFDKDVEKEVKKLLELEEPDIEI